MREPQCRDGGERGEEGVGPERQGRPAVLFPTRGKGLRVMRIFILFLFALFLSIIAQVVSYRSGPRTRSRQAALLLGIVAVVLLAGAGRLGMMDLRNFVEYTEAVYVRPRAVTPKQADDLRTYSAHHEKYPVTVKVNPLDEEATEYAARLKNALTNAGWDATFSTSDTDPHTLNNGLCIYDLGENSKPANDPSRLLANALSAAKIRVNCGGSTAAGEEYKLFVLVGHRPVALDVLSQ